MLCCHLNPVYQLRDFEKKRGNLRNLSSRLVCFDPLVRAVTREGSCVKRDAQSDSGDCVNSRASIKTRRCPRPGPPSRCFLWSRWPYGTLKHNNLISHLGQWFPKWGSRDLQGSCCGGLLEGRAGPPTADNLIFLLWLVFPEAAAEGACEKNCFRVLLLLSEAKQIN